MKQQLIQTLLTVVIALVWLINGLFCKVLNFVPRHQEIVGSILGHTYARPLTIAIGISEIIMAVWVLSCYQTKINSVIQIVIVLMMNLLEFSLVSELLLWGRANILFALLFSILVYYNAFVLNKND